MPAVNQKSSILSQLGDSFRKSVEKHQHDQVELPTNNAALPPGIEDGVAQLVECKFDVYKSGAMEGKPYFLARGRVVSPDEFVDSNKVKHRIKNRFTQIMEPLCDTPSRTRKTVDDHAQWVLTQLKYLGAHPDSLDADSLEDTMQALVEDATPFGFRTWVGPKTELQNKGGKWFAVTRGQPDKGPYISEAAAQAANPYAGTDPLVNQTWMGRCEWQDDSDPAEGTVDSSAPADEEWTLDQLATAAESKDTDARAKLKEMALELMTEEEFDGLGTWGEVAVKIEELQAGGDSEEAAGEDEQQPAETEWEPQIKEVYGFRPKDKTGKPGKKLVEVKVTAVNSKARTVDVQQQDDPKVKHKGISWDDLETPE